MSFPATPEQKIEVYLEVVRQSNNMFLVRHEIFKKWIAKAQVEHFPGKGIFDLEMFRMTEDYAEEKGFI
jgi:hypothetical protein